MQCSHRANIHWQVEEGNKSYRFASSKKWLNLTFDMHTVISKQKQILCFPINLGVLELMMQMLSAQVKQPGRQVDE